MERIFEVLEELRVNAEKSGEEIKTRQIIKSYMRELKYFKEEQIGSSLIYTNITHIEGAKTIAVRMDFDAVLTEEGTYAHRCGHNGHTAILLDLARKAVDLTHINIVLIFQAAEETAAGAPELIDNGFFNKYKPDMILGCHNLPGYKENHVVIRAGNFNNSVIGFTCSLNGKPSHAAYPEHGINPAYAIARLVSKLEDFESEHVKISITHMKAGEFQYGTSAGSGVILGTIRAVEDKDLKKVTKELAQLLYELSSHYKLDVSFDTTEYFKGIVNSKAVADRIKEICRNKNYPYTDMQDLFSAGEDFGFYLDYTEGCYFGIGAGEKHPDLHTKDYFFNPNNLEYTSKLLFDLISEL